MNRIIAFKLIFATITLSLLFFQIVIWKKISARFAASKRFKIYRAVYFSVLVVCQSILWLAIVYPGRGMPGAFPEWYIPVHKVLLAINYSHFVWLLPISVLWLLAMILRRLTPNPSPLPGEGSKTALVESKATSSPPSP